MPNEPIQQPKPVIIDVPVIITTKDIKTYTYPMIEIRKTITNPEQIRHILSAAFHNQTVIFMPNFTSRIKSISTLLEKGIIYLDKKEDQYMFNI